MRPKRFDLLPYVDEIIDLYKSGMTTSDITKCFRQKFNRPIIRWDVEKLLQKHNVTRSGSERTIKQINDLQEKHCFICNELFIPTAIGQLYCQICIPDHKAAMRYKNYQLSQQKYDALLQQQNNACAICKTSFDKMEHVITRCNGKKILRTRICIDHNHKTGKVRGLLCMFCNTAFGHIENDDWFKEAINYAKNDDELFKSFPCIIK